jgi:RecA-family ATPase
MSEANLKAIRAHIDAGRGPSDPPASWVKPFVWRPPCEIPPREWLYGGHYVREYVSATLAPGGAGKSGLAVAEALAMATGRGLLGKLPTDRFKVAYWNGEDPEVETERRVAAAMMRFGLVREDVEGWLWTGSGREHGLTIALQTKEGTTLSAPDVEKVETYCRANALDCLIIDPFVSSHKVPENDNGAMDEVVKAWGGIAGRTKCAIELVHHTRKIGGGEITAEHGRGAVGEGSQPDEPGRSRPRRPRIAAALLPSRRRQGEPSTPLGPERLV